MNITRRDALKALAGTAALAALPRGRSKDAEAPATAPASSTGSFHHSACRWCYQKIPLEDLAREARRIGLESVELLDPADWPVVQRHGLTCAMANGVTRIPEGLNRLEHHALMVPGMIERIRACADAGLPNVICFSGSRGGMDDELGLENCAAALKQIVGEAERRRITVCMELLNSKVDHKDYMCDHTVWGVELVKRVGSERFKLLYDIYHMQIMEGDVVRTIRENHTYIAHYHTGGVPGRHEIDGGQELNYAAIARAIKETGHRGFVAQEFIPVRDPFTSLAEAVAICTV
ncbi:MAG TPA: TIM barrel protein [Opitutaceae bacterium]|nr:TIM barrel protein [Opitutaceae bacterium]